MNFIINESAQKLRGGYYTAANFADFLVRWVSEVRAAHILEPSCGDGAFLRAIARVRSSSVAEVTACEIDPKEATRARQAVAGLGKRQKVRIHETDFLAWALDQVRRGEQPFDAVVGNPPFIRYQYLDAKLQTTAEKIIRGLGLSFTKHTNAWVPFVVASMALLRPGGRLAMLVPAEILHVLHAGSARDFLLRQCSKVLVLDPEEIWFEETLQGVVLLLAEKRPPVTAGHVGEVAITRVRGKEFLAQSPGKLFADASYVPGERLPGKWMPALLSRRENDLLARVELDGLAARFKAVASVAVGIVTGANKFFLVPDSVVEEYGLAPFAHPMFGRSEHVAGVIYGPRDHEENRKRGLPTNFIWFTDIPLRELPASVRRYIATGVAAELHTRFKCRVRKPWYAVPSVFTAPVGMLKRSHDYPRLVLNAHDAFTTDTAYRIVPKRGSAKTLVYSFVNSLTALSAELEGRHYGGGVLELVPSEINRVLLPVLGAQRHDLQGLDTAFRSECSMVEILETQDARILGALGLSKGERGELRDAWWRLRSRRHRSAVEPESDGGDEDVPPTAVEA